MVLSVARICEKSPCRSASVGTVVVNGLGCASFMLSHAKNQNSLLRPLNLGSRTGPPAVTPYWFRWVTGRGLPAWFKKKSFAVRVLGWLNSQAEPWKELVPLLV